MGNRTLILIRHGQYHQHPKHSEYGRLTAVGVRQAVVIRADGTARILAFNDVGHLPRSLQKFA